MARNVDERIVEMQFNNKQFESGVKESIDSLDKLKDSLELDGATKGFEKLDAAAGKVSFNPLQNGIEVVTQKFTALEIIGITALQRITNQAMATGERLIKSMTIAPITQGWDKYESKVESVQTIMNATGKEIDEVNHYLDKLIWFTNETSYDFTNMVANVGKFTSNKVDLDVAVDAMVGIANAAGLAGVNAEKANHAMTGIAKAIGKGFLDRQSWMWLETAGFQVPVIKEAFMEAAEAAGTLKKESEGIYRTMDGNEVSVENFVENLKDGWLTTEAINSALGKFSVATNEIYDIYQNTGAAAYEIIKETGDELDEYSLRAFKAAQETKTWGDAYKYVKDSVSQGWATTWEYMFGNYEDAKAFFGEIVELMYDLFVASGDTRNEVLKLWNSFGGAQVFRKALINLLTVVDYAVNQIREAFVQLFPIFGDEEGMAKLLNKISLRFEHITKDAKKAFEAIDTATEPAQKAIKKVINGIQEANKAGEQTAEVLASISEVAQRVIRGEFGNGQERINNLRELGYCFEEVQNKVNELMGNEFRYTNYQKASTQATNDQVEANAKLSESAKHVHESVEQVYTTFDNIVSTFRGVIAVYQIVINLFQAFVRVASELIDPLKKVGDGVLGITGSLGDAIVQLKDFLIESDFFYNTLKKIVDFIAEKFAPVFEQIGKVLDSFKNRNFGVVVDWFKSMADSVKSMFSKNVTQGITALGTGFGAINARIAPVVDFTGVLNDQLKETANRGSFLGDVFTTLSSVFSIIKTTVKAVGTAIYQFLGPAMRSAVDTLGNVADFFKDFVDKKWSMQVFNFKEGLREFFVGLATGNPVISELKNNLMLFTKPTLFKELFAAVTGVEFSLKNLGEIIGEYVARIADYFKYGPINIIDPAKDLFLGIAEALGFGIDQIKKVLSKINFGKIFAAAGFGVLTYFVIQMSRLAGAVPSFLQSISGVVSGFKEMFKVASFKMKMQAVTGVVLGFAALIAALGWSITEIAKIKNIGGLWSAFAIISLIILEIGAILGAMLALSKDANAHNLAIIAGSLLAIGITLAIFASVMNQLIGMPLPEYAKGLGLLAGVFIVLGVVIAVFSKITSKRGALDPSKMAALLIFVVAVKTVISSLTDLAAQDPEKLLKALGVYVGIIILLSIFMSTASEIKFSGGAGLALMVISISLFVKTLKKLADEDYRKIYATLLKMVPIFLAILTLITFAQMLGDNGYKFAAVLLSIGIMFRLIASSLKIIGGIGSDDLWGAVGAISVLLIVVTALVGFLTYLSKNMTIKTNQLNMYSVMFVAIGICLFALASALKMLAGLGIDELIGPIIALSATILAVGGALALIKKTEFDIKSAIAMSIVIGVVAGALLILSWLIKDIPSALTAALMLTGVIAAVGYALHGISTIDFGSALSSALAMTLVIGAVVAAFYYLLQQDMDEVMRATVAMAAVILSVSGSIWILQAIKPGVALKVVKSLAIIIGGLTILVAALAGLLSLVDESKLETGLNNFVMIMTKFGEAIGGVVSGLIEGLTSRLPQAGKNLSDFADNLNKFIDVFSNKQVSWSNIAESSLSLANAINSLKRINVSPEDALKMNVSMGYMAGGLNSFYKSIRSSKIDVAMTKQAADAIDILVGILQYHPDISQQFWESLGTGLDSLGGSLVKFSDTVKGQTTLDEGAINKSIRIIKSLGRAATEIGDLGDFSGWGTLMQFSSDVTANGKPDFSGLTQLGQAIVSFNDTMKSAITGDDGALDSTYLTTAINAIKDLATAASEVPNAGGQLSEWFGGFQGWKTISSDLISLGTAIVSFSDATKGLKEEDLANGLSAVSSLNELAKTLDNPFTGGILSGLLGDNTLGGLANALAGLAPELAKFASTSRGLDPKETSRSFSILTKIIDAAKDIYGYSLISAGNEIAEFCTYFKTAYETLASVNTNNDYVSQLIADFRNLFNADTLVALGDIGRQMSESMATAFSSNPSAVQDSVNTFVSYYINNFIDHTKDFEETGRSLRTTFKIAFSGSEARNDINDSVDRMADEMVAKIRTHYGDEITGMRGAGAYLIEGVIQGIRDRQEKAEAAAWAAGDAISRAFRHVTGINSPSKVWYGFGGYLIDGLAYGIEQAAPTAVKQIEDLANAMNGAFDNTINLEAQAEGITPVFQSTLDSLDTSSMARRASRIGTSRDYNSAIAASNKSFTIQSLNVYGTENMDVNELSDAVIDKLNRQLASENSRWAY